MTKEYLKRQKLRHEQKLKRYNFVRRRLKKILSLSMDGWPRMYSYPNKDYLKWLELVYECKIKGLYSPTTATCDVIANLHYKAEEIKKMKGE